VHSNFTPAEHASYLAGKAVAHATGFLDGRNDAVDLGRNARAMLIELIAAPDDAVAKPLLDVTRLLTVAMMGAAAADGEARQDRWMHVMAALVELARHENIALRTAHRPAVAEGGAS
jgi:hypothetical protein